MVRLILSFFIFNSFVVFAQNFENITIKEMNKFLRNNRLYIDTNCVHNIYGKWNFVSSLNKNKDTSEVNVEIQLNKLIL